MIQKWLLRGWFSAGTILLMVTPTFAQTVTEKEIPQVSEVKQFAKSASLLVQTPTTNNSPQNPPFEGEKQESIVSITGVKANPTDKGLEVILQTSQAREL
ncbi:MAG: hypothetical protein ACFCUV_13910, partial [Rivularia sp. (in: cyanobacteria)]